MTGLPSGLSHWTAQPSTASVEAAATIFPSGRTRTAPGWTDDEPVRDGVSTNPVVPKVGSGRTASGPVTAAAVRVTGWVPSATASSTGETANVAAADPAG